MLPLFEQLQADPLLLGSSVFAIASYVELKLRPHSSDERILGNRTMDGAGDAAQDPEPPGVARCSEDTMNGKPLVRVGLHFLPGGKSVSD